MSKDIYTKAVYTAPDNLEGCHITIINHKVASDKEGAKALISETIQTAFIVLVSSYKELSGKKMGDNVNSGDSWIKFDIDDSYHMTCWVKQDHDYIDNQKVSFNLEKLQYNCRENSVKIQGNIAWEDLIQTSDWQTEILQHAVTECWGDSVII